MFLKSFLQFFKKVLRNKNSVRKILPTNAELFLQLILCYQ